MGPREKVRDAVTPLWITESDVVSLMDMPAAIRALEAGLRSEASGAAANMAATARRLPVVGSLAFWTVRLQ